MGMETGLVTFLILSSFNLLLKHETENKFSNLAFSALLASLAYLTRPDAILNHYSHYRFSFLPAKQK